MAIPYAIPMSSVRKTTWLSAGLSSEVGPPGTGKTEFAVQVIACLYDSFSNQRIPCICYYALECGSERHTRQSARRDDIQERGLFRLGVGAG